MDRFCWELGTPNSITVGVPGQGAYTFNVSIGCRSSKPNRAQVSVAPYSGTSFTAVSLFDVTDAGKGQNFFLSRPFSLPVGVTGIRVELLFQVPGSVRAPADVTHWCFVSVGGREVVAALSMSGGGWRTVLPCTRHLQPVQCRTVQYSTVHSQPVVALTHEQTLTSSCSPSRHEQTLVSCCSPRITRTTRCVPL